MWVKFSTGNDRSALKRSGQIASLDKIVTEGNMNARLYTTSPKHLAFAGLMLASTLWLTGCQPGLRGGAGLSPGKPIRAIWVTRWDYKDPRDVKRVMQNCRQAGFNTVLFQVRGNGTVLYPSRLEPWAEDLGSRHPGFDPLALACREAHRQGMALHAWVNVVPGWRGKEPPTDRRQLYWTRPDWFWHDAAGRREPLGWYNNLNPCYPEVRRYITDVLAEIVSKYPIDGLHMDYVRFPNDVAKTDYPRDARTLSMFRGATGKTPETDPGAWNEWRTEQITQLVRSIRGMVRQIRPTVMLSAAVGAHPDEARRKHFQDCRRWISEGLVDAVFPMNYATSMDEFSKRTAVWTAMRPNVPVIMGIMVDKRDSQAVVAQVDHARRTRTHFAAFAYNSLFERLDKQGHPINDEQSPSRASLRRNVIPYVTRLAASRP